MRPGAWFLLPLLLSLPTSAREAEVATLQRRTLVLSSRAGVGPPTELSVKVGVATVVCFDSPARPDLQVSEQERTSLGELMPIKGCLVILPKRNLGADERVEMSVLVEPGAEPLRFVLVTRLEAVDLSVKVVRASPSAEDEGVAEVARSLLAAPAARPRLDVAQRVTDYGARTSSGQVDSVVWMGRRFFATLAVRVRKKRLAPWGLIQVRVRTPLPDGVLWEAPARLVSGPSDDSTVQRYIATGVLPEGASGVELALDGAEALGVFQPLHREAP
ncbi:hypothetical protein MEBOL_002802 [Melittangium boletus DSM 14713]|uniref:DUF2381 family protein n=1 Tax=Melittangium boletus DSM 14713 TaxID=1294270 RepID=A0A250IDP0_9BACT|nr:DUF2381 family protein [Melittangium boletus]ATB29353.1 hypothetical protein MEBOL_002802 [Melittangium boletus DSM 14713]